MEEKSSSKKREIWLDGLRGVAALIVACLHFTLGLIGPPHRSFWSLPASENRYLIQLPPFRILFAGQAMVDIFFVISGYSISTGLIRVRNEGSSTDFYRKLTSSVLRRMFRLCFPVTVLILISHVLYYVGVYKWKFDGVLGCADANPWQSPMPHIRCMIRSFVSILNLQSNQNPTLNNHLWTIPIEIRGSFDVYLALLGLPTMRKSLRLWTIVLIGLRSIWNGEPIYLGFFAGLFFAELDAASSNANQDLQPRSSRTLDISSKTRLSKATSNQIVNFSYYVMFVVGIYLMCLPLPTWRDGAKTPDFSPEWNFLSIIPPLPWWEWEVTMRTWHTIGSISLVGALRVSPKLRAPFEWRIPQFLGYISFSLYLIHQTIFRIIEIRLLNWTCLALSGMRYGQAEGEGRGVVIFFSWVLTTTIVGTVLFSVSRYMARSVDQRSVGFAYRMEKILTKS